MVIKPAGGNGLSFLGGKAENFIAENYLENQKYLFLISD